MSWDVAHDRWTKSRRDRRRQAAPDPRAPSICPLVWRRRCGFGRCGKAVPPESVLARSPLQFEPMRSSTWRASSEIENFDAVIDSLLHARPIKKHVGRLTVILAQRRRPGHFELVAKAKTAPGRDRLPREIRAREPAIIRKLVSDPTKECQGLSRRSEITHVAGENRVKRVHFLSSEGDCNSLFLRTTDLTSKLCAEFLEQSIRTIG